MCNASTMIISKADQFLFVRIGMTLLASGKNKDKLISSIRVLSRMLSNAKPVKNQQNYVFLLPSVALHKTIDVVFENIFVGCDRTWIGMHPEVKFSLIVSTIWNKCFNSLWKLSIAVKNENVREGNAMLRRDLAVGVQEYEDRALKVLAKSIMNCLQRKTMAAQQAEPSMELVKVTPYHVQEANDLRQLLQTKESEIESLQSKIVDEKKKALESFRNYERTTKDRTVQLKSRLDSVEEENESLRTRNLTLTKLIDKMSRNIEQDTLLSSGQFVDVPPGVIALKNSVNRLITRLEKNKALIQKKASSYNTNAQPKDVDKTYEFFEKFEEITDKRIGDIIRELALMDEQCDELEQKFSGATSST